MLAKTSTLIFFLLLALRTAPTWGVVETKLTASDASSEDWFAESVAISGNKAIVGAQQDDDAGDFSGSAYVFDVMTGNELLKLSASDAATGNQFGNSVAIYGETVIVGSWADDFAGTASGSAYVFDTTTGNELFKLTASDATALDRFGYSVAISGNKAVVGAFGDSDGGKQSGSAYVFNVDTGVELLKLTAADAAPGDDFGWSVGIDGDTAIVGSWADEDNGKNSGSSYLFDLTTGNQLFKIIASDAAAGDKFGVSVAISGNTAIIGAPGNDDAGAKSGSAYLFDVTTGSQLFKLTASDSAAGDDFGWSVAIDGNIAIVGAYSDDDGGDASGSAYLFDVTTGNELLKLTATDAGEHDFFGTSVSINDSSVIVGAFADDDGGSFSGSAYLYTSIPEPKTFLLGAIASIPFLMNRRRSTNQTL